jgi:glycosyltransferase involved in cell wall biosynthesis
MKYSIVITNYNYGNYLEQAIKSALLVSDDVIVVDDCSLDNSKFVLEDTRDYITRIYLKDNMGVAVARNTGIKLAKYDYIICLDADDTINPEIRDIIPTSDILAIGVQHFEGRNDIQLPPDNITLEQLKQNNLMPVSSPFSKKIWEKVGGFREDLSGYEDWAYWIDCLKLGATISSIRKPLLNYRIHANSRNVEAVRNHKELIKQII